ncbi:MAG: hypothetical protein B6I20_09715 [Bacteroidetes bacterium 4572_117]|nr:MAG: hypothetical protein B6I20_09715 [Bacteroidetes bacterium 4572_117]
MKNLLLFLTVFMLFQISLKAQQTINGIITDNNKNPLSGVVVKMKGSDFEIFSNQDGTYNIIVPAKFNTLIFSLDGYSELEVKITKTEINVEMTKVVLDLYNLTLEELMNIPITTAGKTEQKISNIPANVMIITRADIEAMGYKSVLEALENIPGLFTHKSYNVILLVNNVNQHGIFNTVPIEAIERIEVVRGPMSVMYGTGAFFGVINIITRQTDEDKGLSMISASLGSMDTYELFGRFTNQNEDISITVNAGLYTSDGLNVPYNELIEDPLRLPTLGVPVDMTTKKQLERDKIYLNSSTTFNDFYFDFTFIEDYQEIIYFFPSINDGSVVKKTYNFATLGYRNEINKKLTIDLKLDYFKGLRAFDFNYDLSDPNLYNTENTYFSEEYKESRLVAEFDVFYKLSPKTNITTGLYSRIELEGTDKADIPFWGSYLTNSDLYFVAEDDNAYTNAFFTKIQFSPFENLIINAGIRLEQMLPFNVHHKISQGTDTPDYFNDRFKGSDLDIIPSFAIIYSLKDKHIFKLLYGKAVRIPTIKTLYADLWAKHSSGIEKEDLMPEKLGTIEFYYITSLFNSMLSPSISIYRNYFTDMILKTQVFNAENDQYYWLYSNYGEMETLGAELTLLANPFNNLKIELSYTLQSTKDKINKEIEVGNSPKSLAYIKLYYSLKNTTFGVTGIFVDKMEAVWSIKNNGREANMVDSYYRFGANLRFNNILNSNLFLNLHVSNLFDHEIRYTSGPDEFSQRGYIGKGRVFRFTAGYKF